MPTNVMIISAAVAISLVVIGLLFTVNPYRSVRELVVDPDFIAECNLLEMRLDSSAEYMEEGVYASLYPYSIRSLRNKWHKSVPEQVLNKRMGKLQAKYMNNSHRIRLRTKSYLVEARPEPAGTQNRPSPFSNN